MKASLFERVGGFAKVRLIVSEFYSRILESERLRPYFDHPGFVAPLVDATRAARAELGPGGATAPLVFTAHSIPTEQARTCDYELQLRAVADLVRERVDPTWKPR